VCDEIVVFCSIRPADSCLISGREFRQKRKDWRLSKKLRSYIAETGEPTAIWGRPKMGRRSSLSSFAELRDSLGISLSSWLVSDYLAENGIYAAFWAFYSESVCTSASFFSQTLSI